MKTFNFYNFFWLRKVIIFICPSRDHPRVEGEKSFKITWIREIQINQEQEDVGCGRDEIFIRDTLQEVKIKCKIIYLYFRRIFHSSAHITMMMKFTWNDNTSLELTWINSQSWLRSIQFQDERFVVERKRRKNGGKASPKHIIAENWRRSWSLFFIYQNSPILCIWKTEVYSWTNLNHTMMLMSTWEHENAFPLWNLCKLNMWTLNNRENWIPIPSRNMKKFYLFTHSRSFSLSYQFFFWCFFRSFNISRLFRRFVSCPNVELWRATDDDNDYFHSRNTINVNMTK